MSKDSSDFDYFDKFLDKTFGEGPIDPDNYSGDQIRKIHSIRERMRRINNPLQENGQIKDSDPDPALSDNSVRESDPSIRPKYQTVGYQKNTKVSDPLDNAKAGSHKNRLLTDEITMLAKTDFRKKLLRILLEHGDQVTSYSQLAQESKGKTYTVRKAMDCFEAQGVLQKEAVRTASYQGLQITLLLSEEKRKKYLEKLVSDQVSDRVSDPGVSSVSDPLLDRKKDKYQSIRDKLLSWTDKQMAEWFPSLFATNFRSANLKQAVEELEKRCKSLDLIPKSLEYAEWELAHGKMLDKEGKPVGNPESYVYVSLINKGVYRRHPEYVDPQEQAFKEEQERQEKLKEQQRLLEEQNFLDWKNSLDDQDLNRLDEERRSREFPLPKEAFLKEKWKSLTSS